MTGLRRLPPIPLAALVLAAAWAVSGCAEKGGSTAARPPATTPTPAPSTGTAPPPAPGLAVSSPDEGTVAPPPPPPVGPPAPGARPRAGYDARVDDLKRVDSSALRGRRIALDPGHGGRFPGSIGSRGVTEAEVNLGVALHLWGLLVDAGANVHMTRTADRDFPAPGDSTLRADLTARVARTQPFVPEVFVSIHHNADPGRRNDVNEIQTYYRFDDPLGSFELGTAVHRRLVRNLGIEAARLLPGNFYVIRNADAPAILTESSYLTNPDVEAKLQLAAKQRLEAEAIFLGLVDHFARGVPRIVDARTEPGTDVSRGGDPRDAAERPWIVLAADRPLDAARLTFDGAEIDTAAIRFDGMTALWRPSGPLQDGTHTAAWTARASGGGWSRVARDTFQVDLPVARVAFEAFPPGDLAAGQTALLTLRALDRHDRPVSDTLRAVFTSRVGATMVDTMGVAGPGQARAYARMTGGSLAAFVARPRGATAAPQNLTLQLVPPGQASRWTTGYARARDGAVESPVDGALVAFDTTRASANVDGYYALAVSPAAFTSGAATMVATAPGYVCAANAPAGAVQMLAVGGGALRGRKIALDPAGGGADTTGLGLGVEPVRAAVVAPVAVDTSAVVDTTKSFVMDDSLAVGAPAMADSATLVRLQAFEADANLRVARALREYLEAAGATVVLTRDQPESLTAVDRLRRTEAFAPERVVVISHRAPSGRAGAGHYFSSTAGRGLATRIVSHLEERGVVAPRRARVSESASYVVAQTAAVAVSVNLPTAAPLYTDASRGARPLRDEAYALYLALLEDLGSDPKSWRDVAVVTAHGAAPEAGVPVTLDGRWTLFTDAKGRVRFDGLPEGARLTVAADTARAAVVLPATAELRMELGVARP